MTTPFWSNEPTILFHKESIFELYPVENMSFESKLNAISRLVVLLSILGFLITMNWNFIIMGIITLTLIYAIYKFRKQKLTKKIKEGFNNPEPNIANSSISFTTTNPVTLETVLKTEFHPVTKKNPMGNVLLTEIMDNPQRKSAQPAFNPDVNDDINRQTKKMVQYLNPGIKNTNKQLYGDLGQNYDFDWSMRNFYSMPNTRIENDQGAYSKWLYGSMYSGKDSGLEGAIERVKDNYRYTLY